MGEKILEVCTITPPLGSPSNTSLTLTFFDLLLLHNPPSELLLFYEVPHQEPYFSNSILPKLKHSLSQTLGYFLPASGTLSWNSDISNLVVTYRGNDGVLLTVAESDADFYHLSGKNIRQCREYFPLVARLARSSSQVPLIALKVTVFPNKGFCIGIATHHGLFDANSGALFMKCWASLSKFGKSNGLGPELTPVFDRTSIRELFFEHEKRFIEFIKGDVMAKDLMSKGETEPPLDRVRRTFEISGSDVRKLKELVYVGLATNKVQYLSTFTVIYAYIAICMVKVRGLNNKRVRASILVDSRASLNPPQPKNYFGNCVAPCSAELDTHEVLGKDGMALIVTSIRKGVKGLQEDGVLKRAQNWLPNGYKTVSSYSETTHIYVGSTGKFGFQTADFGWGNPRKVEINPMDKSGSINYTEAGDGSGGIDIEVSLNKNDMERFSLAFDQGLGKPIKHKVSAL